jgi:hypothetical protein
MAQLFIFSKKHPDRKRLDFIVRAIDGKHKIATLRCLSVEDGLVVGTDGTRIHYAYVDNIPNGIYSFERNGGELHLVEENLTTYPDWKKVLPDTTTMKQSKQIFSFKDSLTRTTDIYAFWKESGCCVNFDYLKDLTVEEVSYNSYWKDEFSPVLFAGRNGAALGALIQPIKGV